jgi:sugar phosphate isomerase/epimerase
LPDDAPAFSISQITTFASTFAEDLDAYRKAGVDGIGIWELKLPEGGDSEALERYALSGLGAASAVPAIPSILPLPLFPGPDDPAERVDAICASLERLSAFRPSAVVCLTGPTGKRNPDDARALVVDGLQTICGEAGHLGLRIGLEPINREGGENWTMINSIPDAAALVDDVHRPELGIQFDTWHLWNTETLLDDIERESHRFVGVHVSDWREPTRSWADRVLPGDGVADLPGILDTLDRTGWDGFYDLEIFSDNGTFSNTWPDSLWDVPAEELARRGKAAFASVWQARMNTNNDWRREYERAR